MRKQDHSQQHYAEGRGRMAGAKGGEFNDEDQGSGRARGGQDRRVPDHGAAANRSRIAQAGGRAAKGASKHDDRH